MKVGVILNPQARKGDAAKFFPRLCAVAKNYSIDLCYLTGDDAASTEKNAKAAVATGEIAALFAVGGDGMVHIALQAVAGSEVPLGIIAVGSGNDIAREFGFPIHSLEESMHHMLSSLVAGNIRAIDTMEIISDAGSTHALAIVSFGVDADVNYRTNNLQFPKGNLRYIRALFPALRAYRPYGVRITANGKTASGNMMLLCVANTRYFGGGFNVAPAARPDDGKLNVVLLRSINFWELCQLLPKLFLGKHMEDERLHEILTSEVQVEADTSAGIHPPHVMADGEYIADLPLTVRIRPHGVRLIF